jgi:hypothetical protein
MSLLQGLEFHQTIEATERNAVAIQRLTLQDVIAGGFEEPNKLADPSNPKMVETQLQKLRAHPERYSGYSIHGELVAYLKHGEWRVQDELPFVTVPMSVAYQAGWQFKNQWGVFGLVVSDGLADAQRDVVLSSLLQLAIDSSVNAGARMVNIVIHDHDPVLTLAVRNGFMPVGKPAEAEGAPGLLQRRYQRLASQ